ncbi:MAG: histidine kinase [Anaerolineales bacterium]|nr:histidine kinase [Anaerolineales bacterium]
MKSRLDGLRLQLLGLIILPFSLLLLAFAIAGVRIHQDAMRRLVAERDERSVRAAVAAISQQLHHQESAVQTLALRLTDGISPETILDQAEYLSNDFDKGIAVLSLDGDVLAASMRSEVWFEPEAAELITGLGDQEAGFSDPILDNTSTIVLAAARRDGWVVMGGFTISNLIRTATLVPVRESDSYSIFLVDASGHVLTDVGTAPADVDLSAHPGVQAALRGETGSSFIPAEDGEHVVAFSQILPTGWALIIEEPWELVASPVLDLSLIAPLALVPALGVTLIALWFGSNQVVGPLRKLEQKADELASGKYDAIEDAVGGIAEIQHLQQTLALMSRRIRAAQDALRGYINTMTRTQEDERRRLARELHDETIQDLIALSQQVQMIGISLRNRGLEDVQALKDLHQSAQEAIERVRRLSRGLRPIYLEDLGLMPALEMLARDTQDELEIPVEFQLAGEIQRLGPETELALYRVVQEALSNVGRHAQAGHVWLKVKFDQDMVRIDVRDDGKGFRPPPQTSDLAREGHYGLIGMAERAELIEASLDIQSRPGEGTRITVQLPLDQGG